MNSSTGDYDVDVYEYIQKLRVTIWLLDSYDEK